MATVEFDLFIDPTPLSKASDAFTLAAFGALQVSAQLPEVHASETAPRIATPATERAHTAAVMDTDAGA